MTEQFHIETALNGYVVRNLTHNETKVHLNNASLSGQLLETLLETLAERSNVTLTIDIHEDE